MKSLRDIIGATPKRMHNELDGNTKDEQEIIAKIRSYTKKYADLNGNGDDVFSASKIDRDEKKVVPGEDEKKYAEFNGEVKNIGDDKEDRNSWNGRTATGC